MMKIEIPYGKKSVTFEIDDKYIKGILTPEAHSEEKGITGSESVIAALQNPINSLRLSELASQAKRMLLITSDHTRPVPSKITIPLLLEEARSKNKELDVRILVATGCHRPMTRQEMVDKFGEDIVKNERLENHNSFDKRNLVYKGFLPSGGELWLNSVVDWADLVISEGFIEPHFFAGYSGGRKSILPGVAGEKTVYANHCYKFIESEKARTGMLDGNPIHIDMIHAAKVANLKFILNVALDSNKNIINAFAGQFDDAHRAGCSYVESLCCIKPVPADIVITSNGGYPLDQNLYQAVKGMTAAEQCVRDNGVIIMVAACNDGHGGESFYRWFAESASPEDVINKMCDIASDDTLPDQWQAQILARVLLKARVIVVTDMLDPRIIEDMNMLHASNSQEAMEIARGIVGNDADVVVIPDGVSVIVK